MRSYTKWFIIFLLLIGGVVTLRRTLILEVVVTNPTRGPAVEAIYATGTVEAAIMIPIASRTTARLTKLNVDEGDIINKDLILAELESSDLKGSLERLQAEETFARSEYERGDELRSQGVYSSQDYERSRASWEAATAAVAEARARVGFLQLISPTNGQVIRRDGEVGQLIPAGQPVFWISASSLPRISAEVDEEDIAKVKVDQAVIIRADAFPGQVFHGKVQQITPKGDPVSRSYRVRVALSGEVPLQIGMTTELNIILNERKNAILIPATSLSGMRVWAVSNGRLESRIVTTGARGPDLIEVIDGISIEDTIVAFAATSLTEGKKVRSRLLE